MRQDACARSTYTGGTDVSGPEVKHGARLEHGGAGIESDQRLTGQSRDGGGERSGSAGGLDVVERLAGGQDTSRRGAGRGGNDVRAVGEGTLVETEEGQLLDGLHKLRHHVVGVGCECGHDSQSSKECEHRARERTDQPLPLARRTGVPETLISVQIYTRIVRETYLAMRESDSRRNSPGIGESASPLADSRVLPVGAVPFRRVSTKNWASNSEGVESNGAPGTDYSGG